jgi:uncharacterized membrane protein YhaH (DUF805 family)
MSLTDLLFSFKGRINRKPWWLASVAVGAISSLTSWILEFAAKSSGSPAIDPETSAPTGAIGVVLFALGLANIWIGFALGTKRLHDLDRSGWWLAWQMLALIIATISAAVATVLSKEEPYATDYIVASFLIAAAFGLAALVIGIWLFVQIGFLRGTNGPNRFGPDPLGAVRADAQL